jgi:hypothetical protein
MSFLASGGYAYCWVRVVVHSWLMEGDPRVAHAEPNITPGWRTRQDKSVGDSKRE